MLTLALPNRGRLASGAASLVERAGFDITRAERGLQALPRNPGLKIIFVHHKDCGKLVKEGLADIGVTAEDILAEYRNSVAVLSALPFGNCKIVVAVLEESKVNRIEELENATIATKYPQISRRWFSERGLSVRVRHLHGSVEIAPSIEYADAIVDSYETGATAIANRLEVLETIMTSQAVLIGRETVHITPEERSLSHLLIKAARSVSVD